MSVQGFSKGPDGGRDAKFVGTAELIPSKQKPWVGKTIIQAKHTNGINRYFNENDFYNPDGKSSTITDEIPRIQKLKSANDLDNYILFSNRRLSGNAESEIRSYISNQCSISEESILLCGVEQLELWLYQFPQVSELADLDPIDSPLQINSEELAEIIENLANQIENLSITDDDPPTPRISYDEKNKANNMTELYAKRFRRNYLKDTIQVKEFLSAPSNIELLRLYESIADEFQFKIISKRKDYQTFDEVIEYLFEYLFQRDPILRKTRNKRLTRVMLFYMYWNCDIGETNGIEAN
ncbi:MAG: hypothetical protein JW712_00505 [Dehalococcoidales bacterium]|nr:hypothetical protein [Dehalococcoidales bacterium]